MGSMTIFLSRNPAGGAIHTYSLIHFARHPIRLPRKRSAEILDDFLRCFNPDGEPDELVRDTQTAAFIHRDAGVRGYRRARDERFNAAQARSLDRQGRALNKSLGFFDAAFQFEADHSTETIEQLAGALVVRMALKAGISHPGN